MMGIWSNLYETIVITTNILSKIISGNAAAGIKATVKALSYKYAETTKTLFKNMTYLSMQCLLCQVARFDKIRKKILSLKISFLKTKAHECKKIKHAFCSSVTNPRAYEWRYMLIRELHMEVWLSRCFEWKSNCPSRSVQLQMSLEAKAP